MNVYVPSLCLEGRAEEHIAFVPEVGKDFGELLLLLYLAI